MIKRINATVTDFDGNVREYERDYVGALTLTTLGHIFGDEFWELFVSCVAPFPNGKHLETIRDMIREEVMQQLQEAPPLSPTTRIGPQGIL